ncbi:hypothetical protein MITSMUL_04440 [Mitsuokella multacida DSM 20544]|uniref:Uncharacterized protein n=1 Tax=Mitsuokella multacida DSM 20544 TaxID=500635 RepID=C9KMK4_9FIRM|nr:hypothetical protein MITSMUL_04440 [Mitsuokella multacida DSM 20544]
MPTDIQEITNLWVCLFILIISELPDRNKRNQKKTYYIQGTDVSLLATFTHIYHIES